MELRDCSESEFVRIGYMLNTLGGYRYYLLLIAFVITTVLHLLSVSSDSHSHSITRMWPMAEFLSRGIQEMVGK